MGTRCLGGFSVVWVAKLLISPVKIRIPKNDQIWPEIGIFGHFGPRLAGSFGSLLVGWLVVLARGLYLAWHLFSLCRKYRFSMIFGQKNQLYLITSLLDHLIT